MAKLGADVAQLDRLAQRFELQAQRMTGVDARTTAMLAEVWWQGADADRIRTWWNEHGGHTIRSASEWLDRLADELRHQAEGQRTASGVGGGGGGGGGGGRRPTSNPVASFFGNIVEGVVDVFDGEEDDDAGQSRGFGLPGPVDDWIRDGGESVVDRGSTLLEYAVRTIDRRAEHPIQSLVDVVTGTAAAEDIFAGIQIAFGDAEIANTAAGNDAVFLTHAWAPFEGGAITIGHTVAVNDTAVSPELVAHELQHVYDVEDVGGLGFYGSYGIDYLWNYVVEGKTGPQEAYRDIFWEQRGYRTGGHGSAPPNGILDGIWKKIW